ncbi:hypothetical protein [Nocardia callitridis]|uniref:Uncharacterized protein n=1 Tax=Nocardia callitridis TaxID=648753 RepID=A0ABP9KEH3_9NOCA
MNTPNPNDENQQGGSGSTGGQPPNGGQDSGNPPTRPEYPVQPQYPSQGPSSPADSAAAAPTPPSGRIQRQEPGVTQPRPPTVAEARARDKARQQAEQQRQAQILADQQRDRTRKRVMKGTIAVVGVAALVGGGYLGYRALHTDKVTASCVKVENGQEVVVPDNYCGEGRPGFSSTGGLIFIGGGPQYRYNYGGTGTIGQPPVGGTTVKPKNAEIKTKSGSVIQRGGLGSKSTSGGS